MAVVIACAPTATALASSDVGNIVPYRRACIDGTYGRFYHRDYLINDRSPAYILRGADAVRRFCAPVIDEYLSSDTFR